jgi:uncharacterized membrane protein (DUF485 family)
MATNAPLTSDLESQRRRAKRTAALLGLIAATFYIGFIVLTYFRSQH